MGDFGLRISDCGFGTAKTPRIPLEPRRHGEHGGIREKHRGRLIPQPASARLVDVAYGFHPYADDGMVDRRRIEPSPMSTDEGTPTGATIRDSLLMPDRA